MFKTMRVFEKINFTVLWTNSTYNGHAKIVLSNFLAREKILDDVLANFCLHCLRRNLFFHSPFLFLSLYRHTRVPKLSSVV